MSDEFQVKFHPNVISFSVQCNLIIISMSSQGHVNEISCQVKIISMLDKCQVKEISASQCQLRVIQSSHYRLNVKAM